MKYLKKIAFPELKYLDSARVKQAGDSIKKIKTEQLPKNREFVVNRGPLYYCNECNNYYVYVEYVDGKFRSKEELIKEFGDSDITYSEYTLDYVTPSNQIYNTKCRNCRMADTGADVLDNFDKVDHDFALARDNKEYIKPSIKYNKYYHGLQTGWIDKNGWLKNLYNIYNTIRAKGSIEITCSSYKLGDIGICVTGDVLVASGEYVMSQYDKETGDRYYVPYFATPFKHIERDENDLTGEASEIIIDVDNIEYIWVKKDKVANNFLTINDFYNSEDKTFEKISKIESVANTLGLRLYYI